LTRGLACQAVPLSKPSDAIRTTQQLLAVLRPPLLRRAAALRAGAAGARQYVAAAQPQGNGAAEAAVAPEASALKDGATGTRRNIAAQPPADVAAAVAAVTPGAAVHDVQLMGMLEQLASKWGKELQQVAPIGTDLCLRAVELPGTSIRAASCGGLYACIGHQMTR
jgi:hypothetical protein